MKKFGILFLLLSISISSLAQDDSEKVQTKFEQLASRTGKISKFIDVTL